MNIHQPDKRLKETLNSIEQSPTTPQQNKDLIKNFIDFQQAKGLTASRVLKYAYTLKMIDRKLNKKFTEITKNDVITYLKEINTSSVYAEWTKHDYLIVTRAFYQWIQKEHPPKNAQSKHAIQTLVDLQIKRARSKEKTPEHMLTPEEILQIADKTTNARDRAFILVFYESCCRIGEILPVKLKDLKFDEYGCLMYITGKTGVRPVRLLTSQPAISNWLTNHPDRDNNNGFLFCGLGRVNQKEMLSYSASVKVIKDASKKAGITKRTNTHKFRASRATELSKYCSDSIISKIGGWRPGSRELQTYIYLSNRDTDQALLSINGLLKKEDVGKGFKLIICPRCHTRNSPDSKLCTNCSLGFDEKSVDEYERRKELPEKLENEITELRAQLEQIKKIVKITDLINESLANSEDQK